MTRQADLFRPMCAPVVTQQGQLFDPADGPGSPHRCQCGEYLERTESGYLCCPKGHGKLLTEPPAVEPADKPDAEDDDEPAPASEWPRQARRIAKRHARRDNWHGRRWHCQCGACSRARLDGFTP
jgi:hypothetical protein